MGWAKELFFIQDEEAKEFECAICLEVFRNPAQLRCEHHFCFNCIRKWLFNQSANDRPPNCPICRYVVTVWRSVVYGPCPPNCPSCKSAGNGNLRYVLKEQEITQFEVRKPNSHLLSTIGELEMKCINNDKGCNVRVLYSEMEQHFEQCPYKEVEEDQEEKEDY